MDASGHKSFSGGSGDGGKEGSNPPSKPTTQQAARRPPTVDEVLAALQAETEITKELASFTSGVAQGQPAPAVLAAELNRELEARDQPPHLLLSVEEAAPSAAAGTGSEKELCVAAGDTGGGGVPPAREVVTKRKRKRAPSGNRRPTDAPETSETTTDSASSADHMVDNDKHPQQPVEEPPAMKAFREEARLKSVELVQSRIPAKIIHVNSLFQQLVDLSDQPVAVNDSTEQGQLSANARAAAAAAAAAAATTMHTYASNMRTQELITMVKMELADLLEIVGAIRLWLQFNLPPAGDKDFESVVKEEIANEMEHVNSSGLSVIHMLKHYPISRALLLTQTNKHQGIDDFRHALLFMDYNHQLSLRRWLTDLRNMYLSLMNTIRLNISELHQPQVTGNAYLRKKRLSESLSPPSARRQSQSRGASTNNGRRTTTASRYGSSPFNKGV